MSSILKHKSEFAYESALSIQMLKSYQLSTFPILDVSMRKQLGIKFHPTFQSTDSQDRHNTKNTFSFIKHIGKSFFQ